VTTAQLQAVVTSPGLDERMIPLRIHGMDVQPDGMGRAFVPDVGRIYYWRSLGEQWRVQVQLSGPRMLANGTVSARSRARRCYWMPEDTDPERYPSRPVVPEFLREFVEHYWPAR
jgi:hypothetical protein